MELFQPESEAIDTVASFSFLCFDIPTFTPGSSKIYKKNLKIGRQ